MVSGPELRARVGEFLRFSRQEVIGLIAATLAMAFLFSFRDWGGDQLNVVEGVQHFLVMVLVVVITLLFRGFCQKTYGLTEGYKADFKVWWVGLAIMFVVGVISVGKVPLVFVGTMVASLMVRQRLGEFRYGFSYWNNMMIAFWGLLANMILAIVFALGLYFSPQSYFFYKGLVLNLIMGLCSFVPLPQLDGLSIFWGSRPMYFLGIGMVLLAAVLLLSRTQLGLILAIIIALFITVGYLLTASEK
ncbi:TPA: hypothetical protein HA241_06370 [Candidatus Woesearchaeota archaeon]|nr:hypothetical protein [Candidatus Woesearchaeota archaeon]